jgi:hypothetical protein
MAVATRRLRPAAAGVARRGSANHMHLAREPAIVAQREAASVGEYSELLHAERVTAPEVLESLFNLMSRIRDRRASELFSVLVLGHVVAPRTQANHRHDATRCAS